MKQIKTYVVMPETAPKLKVEKVKALGAEVTFCQNTPEARQAAADKIIRETGATFIHPFDNHQVICGQATVAKEILEELPETEIIIPPVGGGGLLSGSGISAGFYSEKCLVFAAEPEGAADAVKSFSTGKVEKADYVKTLADGLQTHLSERTLQLIRKTVEDVLLAKEASIPKAMELVKTFFDMYIEPSAAVPLTMLMDSREIFSGKKVVLIITGGNIEPSEAEVLIKSDDPQN
jgi:threonine dehydratase